MKNIESTPPSLSNPLAGVSVYPELIAIEPWSTPDPEVREYFEEIRPDAWPVLPPRDQLNPQAREALAVFDKADELRADPGYEATRATSRLLAGAAVEDWKRQLAKKLVDKEVKSGKISPENAESTIKEYTGLCRVSDSVISDEVLNDRLPEDSPLYEFLQPGSSALVRIAILEALNLNEENIKGSVVFGSKDTYNRRVRESERFFDATEEEQKGQLERLLKKSKQRQADEEKRKKEAARVAATEKMFGDNVEGAVRQIEACVESLQQDGYILSSAVNLEHNRENAELVKGSLAELRQGFSDLCYPSGLNVLDYLSETYGADSPAAVLVGAHVLGTGKVSALGSDLATVYRKSDSSEDRP